jgi:hypothetical protein
MELIETKTLGTAASSIEFTSIPQDATDLLIFTSLRTSTNSDTPVLLQFNGNGIGYSSRWIAGDSSGTSSNSQISVAAFTYGYLNADNQTANTFSNHSVYISNYTAALDKSMSADSVNENNSASAIRWIAAGLWANAAAITSLSVICGVGNLVAGSTVSLYKITKGSDGIITTL